MRKTVSIKDVKVGNEFYHNTIKYKKISLTSWGNVICCAAENLTSGKIQIFNPDWGVSIESKLTFADVKVGQKFTIDSIEYIKGEDLLGNPKAISIPNYLVYSCGSEVQVELVK